jgi:hypothetical protein
MVIFAVAMAAMAAAIWRWRCRAKWPISERDAEAVVIAHTDAAAAHK